MRYTKYRLMDKRQLQTAIDRGILLHTALEAFYTFYTKYSNEVNMPEVTITLTPNQIDAIPTSGPFAAKFKIALHNNSKIDTYKLKSPEAAIKVLYTMLKRHNGANIKCKDGEMNIRPNSNDGCSICIRGDTVTITGASSSFITHEEMCVANYTSLETKSVTLTIDRKITADYLKVLVDKETLYKYDKQVLKILVGVLL